VFIIEGHGDYGGDSRDVGLTPLVPPSTISVRRSRFPYTILLCRDQIRTMILDDFSSAPGADGTSQVATVK
jgi:hypothetical protein